MSASKARAKAEELGYGIEDDGYELYLDAPANYCFDQDRHVEVFYYVQGGKGKLSKAAAWAELYKSIGTAEPCKIKECEVCGN